MQAPAAGAVRTTVGSVSPDVDGGPAHPGARLGLPASGPGSVSTVGPRVIAFGVDALIANGLALTALGGQGPGGSYVLAAYALPVWLGTALVGGSLGHHVTGLAVIRLDGARVGLWRGFVRTTLACLLVPAAVWDRDQRGLHDMAAQTVLVRRR